MKASPQIIEFIKQQEGIRLHAYNDGFGNITIGYGHKCIPPYSPDITEEEAISLLETDVAKAENVVAKYIQHPLKQNEFDALVSLVFNIGEKKFAGGSIPEAMNAGHISSAANKVLMYMHDNRGNMIAGLLSRRILESMILLGIKLEYHYA